MIISCKKERKIFVGGWGNTVMCRREIKDGKMWAFKPEIRIWKDLLLCHISGLFTSSEAVADLNQTQYSGGT
jgi:hypothetical protein